MILAQALRTLYGYNSHATARILDTAADLSPEELLAPMPGEQRSVRDTLVHLVSAQDRWLSRWDGRLSPAEATSRQVKPEDFPDMPTIRSEWERVDARTHDFVDALDDAGVERVLEGKLRDGSKVTRDLWVMMLHVANHGTQHRSEIAAHLTALGRSPGDLDLVLYVWTPGGG